MTVQITVDNKEVTAESGQTILDTCLQNNIYIPNLCNHPDLVPSGECGLCLVSIKGEADPAISCTTKVTENLVIQTDTEELRQKQRQILQKILSEHPNACCMGSSSASSRFTGNCLLHHARGCPRAPESQQPGG